MMSRPMKSLYLAALCAGSCMMPLAASAQTTGSLDAEVEAPKIETPPVNAPRDYDQDRLQPAPGADIDTAVGLNDDGPGLSGSADTRIEAPKIETPDINAPRDLEGEGLDASVGTIGDTGIDTDIMDGRVGTGSPGGSSSSAGGIDLD